MLLHLFFGRGVVGPHHRTNTRNKTDTKDSHYDICESVRLCKTELTRSTWISRHNSESKTRLEHSSSGQSGQNQPTPSVLEGIIQVTSFNLSEGITRISVENRIECENSTSNSCLYEWMLVAFVRQCQQRLNDILQSCRNVAMRRVYSPSEP